MQQEAERSARALAGEVDVATLAGTLHAEQSPARRAASGAGRSGSNTVGMPSFKLLGLFTLPRASRPLTKS
jgi:hypothetical protein